MLSQRTRLLLGPCDFPSHLVVACGVGLLLGIGSLLFSPFWALGGILGILFLTAITYRPELGLLTIVLVTSGLVDPGRLPLLKMGPVSLHATDIILLYLLAMLLTKALVDPKFKIVRTPLDIPLIWFYCAVLLSATLAVTQFSLDMNWVLRMLRILTYYLGFFAVTNLIRDRRQLEILIHGLFVIAVLACLAMLIQVLVPSLVVIQSRTGELVTAGREYAGVIRTWMPAGRLVYVMLLVSVCSLTLGRRWLRPSVELARASILSIGVVLSFARNVYLSIIVVLVVLGLLVSWPERFRMVRWAIVGVVVSALLISLPGPDRYATAAWNRLTWGMRPETLVHDFSTQMRKMEMAYGIQSIAQHPLLGIGLRNLYRPASAIDLGLPEPGLRWYIHNAYLWVWIDMGLIGLIPFIWLYSSFLVRGFTRWRKIADLKLRVLVLGFTLAILGHAIINTVAPHFVESWALITFVIILGINELIFRWQLSEVRPQVPANVSRER